VIRDDLRHLPRTLPPLIGRAALARLPDGGGGGQVYTD